jgi:AraC family ethanolamine operon transcriptional activator
MEITADQPVRTHRFENAEEAAAAVPGAQVRYLPLARPTASWQMVEMSLGESRLLAGQMGADTSIFGTLDRNLLYFLAPLSGSGWKTYGKEIGERSLAVLANTTDYAAWIGASIHSMSLQVPVESFARAYSNFAANAMPTWSTLRMFMLDTSAAEQLRTSIASALRVALQRPEAYAEARMGKILEDLMLERLIRAVCTTSRAERPEYRILGSRCNEYLEANAGRCVTLVELREALGVSDRSLRRFFASAYGTSPARFLRVQRLHGVNRVLAEARTTVTNAGMSFGFFDLGRFAGDYRRLFGERPSETLQRARNAGFSKVAGITLRPS